MRLGLESGMRGRTVRGTEKKRGRLTTQVGLWVAEVEQRAGGGWRQQS